MGLPLSIHAEPCLPDRGRPLPDLIEPARRGILQEQSVSGISVAIPCQYAAQERRGEEAGVQMVSVLHHQTVQFGCAFPCAFPGQQSELDGAHILALPVPGDLPILHEEITVRQRCLFCRVAIPCGIFCLSQDLCDLSQQPAGVGQISGSHALARALHGLHRADARLTPLAVIQSVQHRIFGVCAAALLLCGLLRTAQQETVPFLHHLVVVRQNPAVSGAFVKSIRHKNRGIAPARRHAEHRGHEAGDTIRRRNVCHAAIRVLIQAALRQPFLHHRIAVHQGQSGLDENAHISRPAGALTGRTVGGNIAEVSLLAPYTVFYQLIHIGIAAFKGSGDRHLRIDGVSGKLCAGQVDSGLHLCVAEAHNGKARFVVVHALFADKLQKLRCAALLMAVAVLEILLRKVAVLIQCFAAQQPDSLSCVGGQLHLHISGQILPEVQHGFPARGADHFAVKSFLLPDGHRIHAGDGQGVRLCFYAVPAGKCTFQPGIVHFSLLHIVLADGAALGGLHAAVRDADRSAIHLQLEQNCHLAAEQIPVTANACGAAVPAIAQGKEQFIFTLLHKVRHIVGLCAQMLIRSKAAGSQHHIADPPAVQPCHIQAPGGDVQPLALPGRSGERLAQIAGRTMRLIRSGRALSGSFQRGLFPFPVGLCKGVDGIRAVDFRLFCLRADPRALPIRSGQTRFKNSLIPCARLIVFIPQADAPLPLRPGRNCHRRFRVHRGTGNLPALPERFRSGSHFNFICRLAHALDALPR